MLTFTGKEDYIVKKIICKKEYDTETATLIRAYSFGQLGAPGGPADPL